MEILNFIKNYWVLISFFVGEITIVLAIFKSILRGIKCTLRNDIVEIYEECRRNREITKFQFETACLSYEEYKRLKGNSFVDKLMDELKTFKIVD